MGSSSGKLARRREHSLWLVLVLGLLMSFGALSTDVYLPALPAMRDALRASQGSMELTLSGYLAGFSLGQLLWGPVGDRYGRRGPIAAGLLLFVAGSIGCALSANPAQLIGWRVVQAVGACAAPVLARAMVRDLFPRDRAAQILSTLITVMAVAPLLGPTLGGQILVFASWRAIFYLLAALGIVAALALLTIPESLPSDRRSGTGMRAALSGYGELVRDRQLLSYALAGALFYGGFFAYIAGSPFAYMTVYNVSPQRYGLLFALGVLGVMASNIINIRAVPRFGSDQVLRAGASAAAIAGVWTTVAGLTGIGGLPGLMIPLRLYVGTSGFIIANSIAGALQPHAQRAGTASALVGAIHFGSGVFSTALVGSLADGTPGPMAWIIGAAGIGSAIIALGMIDRAGPS